MGREAPAILGKSALRRSASFIVEWAGLWFWGWCWGLWVGGGGVGVGLGVWGGVWLLGFGLWLGLFVFLWWLGGGWVWAVWWVLFLGRQHGELNHTRSSETPFKTVIT